MLNKKVEISHLTRADFSPLQTDGHENHRVAFTLPSPKTST